MEESMSQIEEKGQRVVVKPDQDIVSAMSEAFKSELLSLLNKGFKELDIDMSEIEMIDSIGLGVLIATHNSLIKTGGKLMVSHVSDEIYDLFKTMSLDRHFEVHAASK